MVIEKIEQQSGSDNKSERADKGAEPMNSPTNPKTPKKFLT